MQALLIKFVEKHTPPVISLLIAIGAATWYLAGVINIGLDNMKADIVDTARQPFYLSVEYSLSKQREKIRKDPGDVKEADIELLSVLCSDDFGINYIPKLPSNRRIDAELTCDKLVDLYTDRIK